MITVRKNNIRRVRQIAKSNRYAEAVMNGTAEKNVLFIGADSIKAIRFVRKTLRSEIRMLHSLAYTMVLIGIVIDFGFFFCHPLAREMCGTVLGTTLIIFLSCFIMFIFLVLAAILNSLALALKECDKKLSNDELRA